MKRLRHILSLIIVATATIMLLAHNLIPHHHHQLALILPCTHQSHSCSHQNHTSDNCQIGQQECNHSSCTLLFEFLQSENTISHIQPLVAAFISISPPPISEPTQTTKLYTPRTVPLAQSLVLKDLPRRAPPVFI